MYKAFQVGQAVCQTLCGGLRFLPSHCFVDFGELQGHEQILPKRRGKEIEVTLLRPPESIPFSLSTFACLSLERT